ncbi:hypothetical protein K469DRAFT_655844 [Zopfia rhizophila CBS 207.26]|uniref:Uncharacterized protein n=1 Tax=Zopfia rhizophila CBS 207.26 TaxID=1314779 RepID=A0A6A6EJQ5_9PEZI|nr:hypothetical protein K469DRAFT_655844 [Zopfia rhizophila CBS 207.26]
MNWKEENRKTARLLDFMPSIHSRSKSAERGVDVTLPGPETEAGEQHIDVGYSSDSEITTAQLVPMRVATPKKKYKAHKKKYGKHLEPMSPITEADLTESDAVEEDAIEEDAVLDAEIGNNEMESLFEYGTERAYFGGGVLRPSITEPLFKPLLKEDDELFDSQGDEYGEEKGGEEDAIEALGQDVAKFKMSLHTHTPDTVQLESSLQNLERTLLNNQKKMMKVSAQTVWLKHQHLKMKRRFNELQERSFINDSHYINYVNDINNTKDTCDIDKVDDEYEESEDFEDSLEFDEPVFDTCKVVQFQNIAPGSVKLVDIGPLKSDKIVQMSKISPGQVKTVTLPKREKLHINTLSQNVAVPTVGLDEEGGNTNHPIDIQPDLVDTSSDVRSSRSDKTVKKQPGFHRQKSRVLVQDWLDHNPIIMRPISEQIDPQVLTDQDKDRPPMPPRKDSTPSSNPKHHCILHGHIFQPINLKAVPDRALINNLEVHPYLMNREGVKEHVSVPVACDKCFNTVGDKFWECEIPVCRLAICYACAEQMESEWQDRAVMSWVRE